MRKKPRNSTESESTTEEEGNQGAIRRMDLVGKSHPSWLLRQTDKENDGSEMTSAIENFAQSKLRIMKIIVGIVTNCITKTKDCTTKRPNLRT